MSCEVKLDFMICVSVFVCVCMYAFSFSIILNAG